MTAETVAVMCAGDHGPAVALVSTACVHEHVRVDVPCCQMCVEWAAPPSSLCCSTCENLPADAHCCLLSVTVRELEG